LAQASSWHLVQSLVSRGPAALAMQTSDDFVEIRICVGGVLLDAMCLSCVEMRLMPDDAFHAIRQRAEEACCNKVIKRIAYMDDEGDVCTLAPAAISDALDLCRNGLMELQLVLEDAPEQKAPSQNSAPVSRDIESEEEELVHVKHSHLRVTRDLLEDGVQAWIDRKFTYKNIPQELRGAVLFRSMHMVPGNTQFVVDAPAGSAVYIFSEAHRDGGFNQLGWQKVDPVRFQWQMPDGPAYSLNLWKQIHPGPPMTIPVPNSLVGGIAIQVATEHGTVSRAQELLKMLQDTFDFNLRAALVAFGQAGLHLLSENQAMLPEQCFSLLQPLHALTSGCFEEDNLIFYAQLAIEAFDCLPTRLKESVREKLGEIAKRIGDQYSPGAMPKDVPEQVHPNVICDGCDQSPLLGRRFKCMDCPNFDLCESCFSKRGGFHNPDHAWQEIPAGQVLRPTSVHWPRVECDSCGLCPLVPTNRFKCGDCPDYDLCAACYDSRHEIHPGHDSWSHQGQRVVQEPKPAPSCEPEPESSKIISEASKIDSQQVPLMDPNTLDAKVSVAAMRMLLQCENPEVRRIAATAMATAMEASDKAAMEASDKESMSDISDGWERLDSLDPAGSHVDAQDMVKVAASDCKPLHSATVVHSETVVNNTEHMKVKSQLEPDMDHRGTKACRLVHLGIHHGACGNVKAFVKAVVVNDGCEAWPEATVLKLIDGPSWGFFEMPLGPVPPGETVELMLDLSCVPGYAGDHLVSTWAMLNDGVQFGRSLAVEVTRW